MYLVCIIRHSENLKWLITGQRKPPVSRCTNAFKLPGRAHFPCVLNTRARTRLELVSHTCLVPSVERESVSMLSEGVEHMSVFMYGLALSSKHDTK